MESFKRIIKLILCFTMLSTLLSKQVSAIEIVENSGIVINNEIVEEMLVDSGYSGNSYITSENSVYRHKGIFIDDTYVDYAIYFNY